jgi:GntR family transcriptional regulator/MocR family aminotransferase
VGYLVTPQAALREQMIRLKALHDFHAAWPSQRALLALITGHHLERHIRRMRRRYGEKRALLNDLLAPLAPLALAHGLDAGLHLFLETHAGLDATDIAQRAQARGVVTIPLDRFYYGVPDRQGLVLGYGGLTPGQIVQGANILREVIMERACQR